MVIPPPGGYGKTEYGKTSYGNVDQTPPRVIGATSLDGFRIEVFFDKEMLVDAVFLDPASYTLVPTLGAPSTATAVASGPIGVLGGSLSAIVSHTGTTFGGDYTIIVVGPTDTAYNPVEGSYPENRAQLLTRGEPPTYWVNPISADSIVVEFTTPMLTEAEFTPGIEQLSSYGISTAYPIPMTLDNVNHPYAGNLARAEIEVSYQTSAEYTLEISPSDAVIYDGTYLPSAATTFTGIEIGTGTSVIGTGGLELNKVVGSGSYGWAFVDTSGRMIPSSTYRTDIQIDPANATFTPALFNVDAAVYSVSDGAVQIDVTLTKVAGVESIRVDSGAFSQTIAFTWSSIGSFKLTVVRNQKADIFVVGIDDAPLLSGLTAGFTGAPSISNGTQFLLDPGDNYTISDFEIENLSLTATQTVFSNAWNFLHGEYAIFIGNPAGAKQSLLTERGPLVKGWGDATPATQQDVTVRLDGLEQQVEAVNPYWGEIFLTIPIPYFPAGTHTVEVDYIWFEAPIMEHAGLNVKGLVLNKWEITNNPYTPRFPFASVLPQIQRPDPLYVGHRYIGFQKAYTAALNSPTTLLTNRDPHSVSLFPLEDAPESVSVAYEGTEGPQVSTPPWILEGQDDGSASAETGIYTLIDSRSGSFGSGEPALYSQAVDLSSPSTSILAARLQAQVADISSDGVFTGLGFGVHNNHTAFLVGMLYANGVQHVGMLNDMSTPEQIEAWELAYTASATLITQTTLQISTDQVPVQADDRLRDEKELRFQIFEGSQAGVYVVTELVDNGDGTTTITVDSSNPFPENVQLYGNKYANIHFEVRWDGDETENNLTTYRLVVSTDLKRDPLGVAELFVGGSLSGLALSFDNNVELVKPADTTLLIPTGEKGAVFWGSISRRATNTSLWSFYRYGITPAAPMFSAVGVVVAAEMTTTPDEDINNPWFPTQEFGFGIIDTSGNTLLLKSTAGNNGQGVTNEDLSFGYARIEPFLDREHHADLDATFRVDAGTLGHGDVQIKINDTVRETRLVTLLYDEDGARPPLRFRQLLELPSISLSGLLIPTGQGWISYAVLNDGVTGRVQNQRMQFTQTSGNSESFEDAFDDPANIPDDGRIFEARLVFDSVASTDPNGDTGVFFGGDVGDTILARSVGLQFRLPNGGNPARLILFSPETATVADFVDFDWNDGDYHIYNLLCNPDTNSVSLVVDDAVLNVTAFLDFDVSPQSNRVQMGFGGTLTDTEVEWDYFSAQVMPPSGVGRTLGVYLGGDESDINNYAIPRTDSTTSLNSESTAVVEVMDWTSDVQLRIHRDSEWGAVIIRPDLPPPPFYTGDFSTQITQPSAGWISVEYRHLPKVAQDFATIEFGALDPLSVTQQRWSDVRYRIYQYPTDDLVSPHHMVLNQGVVINSGEFTKDITVERHALVSVTKVKVSLKPTHIYGARVFYVEFEDENGQEQQINSSFLIFDPDSQIITINSAKLAESGSSFTELPYTNTPVTVSFAPGKPITNTYLEAQPLLDSVTLLNEGTPPYPKSQVGLATRVVVPGNVEYDPNDISGTPDSIDDTPYDHIEFVDDPLKPYEYLDFFTVDNGGDTGLLSTIHNDIAPAKGLAAIGMDGRMFTEQNLATLQQPAYENNKLLFASGGSAPLCGNLNDAKIFPIGEARPLPLDGDGKVQWEAVGFLADSSIGLSVTFVMFDNQGCGVF